MKCCRLKKMIRLIWGIYLISGCLLVLFAQTIPGSLKGDLDIDPEIDEYRLLVKFKAETLPNIDAQQHVTFGVLQTASITAFQQFAGVQALKFRRAVQFTRAELQALHSPRQRADFRDAKGFNILDFAGLLYVEVEDPSNEKLLKLARELEQFNEVEYCDLEPLEMPPPPQSRPLATPDLAGYQGYLNPNAGIDVKYAWTQGAKGQGIKVADVEYAWDAEHEDFVGQNVRIVIPPSSNQYMHHGTAVVGILGAGHNGYGINGSAPEAAYRLYSELSGRANAILRAAADFSAGDVILLEMQISGADGRLCPAEYQKSVWDATRSAAQAGLIVVAAAGNGNADLDSAPYAAYRRRGDSGAIIVGAGSSNNSHDKLRFSTYGSKVHVQGWGGNVFTLGNGNFKRYGNDIHRSYTHDFSGTSSATPIVASAVTTIQSWYKQKYRRVLTAQEIRDVLISTGIPQGSGGHIGPLPDIRAAMQRVVMLNEDSPLAGASSIESVTAPQFLLRQNYPNPFNPATTISYRLTRKTAVCLKIYNTLGEEVAGLVNQIQNAGLHQVQFDASHLSNGIYFYRLDAGKHSAIKQMILLK